MAFNQWPRAAATAEDYWKGRAASRLGVEAKKLYWLHVPMMFKTATALVNVLEAGGSGAASVETGSLVISTGATAGSYARIYSVNSYPFATTTKKWWACYRASVDTAVGVGTVFECGLANSSGHARLHSIGVVGPTYTGGSTTLFSVGKGGTWGTAGPTGSISSSVAIDTAIHDLEIWALGTTTAYAAADNETPVTQTISSASAYTYIAIGNVGDAVNYGATVYCLSVAFAKE